MAYNTLRNIYLTPEGKPQLLTIMLFNMPFAPSRPAINREATELIEIQLSNEEIATIASPRALVSPTTGLPIQKTSETVTIFHVDKYLLTRYSDRFAAELKDPLNVFKTTFTYRDVEPQIFGIIANWLKEATIVDQNGEKLSMKELGKLWRMAESFEISSLQNNVVKEICKILDPKVGDEKQAEAPEVYYLELWRTGVEQLRGLCMELLVRRFGMEDVGVIIVLGKALGEREREEWALAVQGKVAEMEERLVTDEKDKLCGPKKRLTIRTWNRPAWYKMYSV